jgi:peroxiredoxin Q/BCP
MPQMTVKYLVLYFYPKDMTPGCTTQAQDFTKLYDQFKSLNTEIIGVSKDSLSSHQKFTEKEKIPYPLLLDEKEKVCNLYGVISEKNMFGKKYLGINRTTFLIDAQRKMIKIWKQVKPANHAQIVLDTIKSQ